MRGTSWTIGLVVALLASAGATGCLTAAATGAGAAAGIAYTNRGAESEVSGDVEQVELRAQKVLEKRGIVIAESQTAPSKRVLEGMKGDTAVTVTMTETNEDYTHVEVVAQKSMVDWDKDYARQIVQDIAKG